MNHPHAPLRLNVGFIVKQRIGYSRNFSFDFASLLLAPDLELQNFTGNAEVSRTQKGLLARVGLNASTTVSCVRCLTPFQLELHTRFTELFVELLHKASEIELVLPEDGHIDLGPIAWEYFNLEIPINPICKPDCKGLCPICGENLNHTQCGHKMDDVDPRLKILKNLLPKP